MHIVAVDGPAGSGKSSVSREAARRLGFGYLDTGAAYRALTWATLQGMISIANLSAEEIENAFEYSISLDPEDYWVKVSGQSVTEVIRSSDVAAAVSQIAQNPEVRKYMLKQTRALVEQSTFAGVIVEGRDITTVIFPEAKTRVLLTASEEVRLARRAAELPPGSLTSKQVSERDKKDAEIVDFMAPANGVSLLDSTNLTFDQTVSALVELVRKEQD
jgi:CMP/dCMP kinase